MTDLYKKYRDCAYRVTTDSRAIAGGEIFFALRGENFDGNAYAASALEKGAAWAVVNEDADLPEDGRFIRVADPFTALQELAIEHRLHVLDGRQSPACGIAGHLPVVGLTGTNGKTTTKELIAAVLAKKYKITATQGNLNNDIGVPLSLLKITPETDIAVIEMGANHPDDIAKLVKVSQPDYGLITNVGKAHLLGFGSFEGVKAAKGELYNWLGAREGSLIFLNEDDADLKEMASRQPCHVFGYGLRYQGAEVLPASAAEPFLRIRLDGLEIRTGLVGAYNATNVLAAIAVGEYFGVSRADAADAIAAYVPKNNRSQMMSTASNTLIVDAYNANPSSMAAALDNFAAVEGELKVALLGDMRELGEDSVAEHVKVVRKLTETGIAAYLVGDEFRKALDMAGIVPEDGKAGVRGWFPDSPSLASFLKEHPLSGAIVLVKGSRGIRMEETLSVL